MTDRGQQHAGADGDDACEPAQRSGGGGEAGERVTHAATLWLGQWARKPVDIVAALGKAVQYQQTTPSGVDPQINAGGLTNRFMVAGPFPSRIEISRTLPIETGRSEVNFRMGSVRRGIPLEFYCAVQYLRAGRSSGHRSSRHFLLNGRPSRSHQSEGNPDERI
ncbi:hypothetical protein [Aurantimonas manganoxydans]|uniref:hypothetical protein n=1 Tax=Aurantimonas manganoxydans TaxID=651183 RepID=UPI0002E6D1DE|nr:hypothetical protein [Aurantimonas manganoxydans]